MAQLGLVTRFHSGLIRGFFGKDRLSLHSAVLSAQIIGAGIGGVGVVVSHGYLAFALEQKAVSRLPGDGSIHLPAALAALAQLKLPGIHPFAVLILAEGPLETETARAHAGNGYAALHINGDIVAVLSGFVQAHNKAPAIGQAFNQLAVLAVHAAGQHRGDLGSQFRALLLGQPGDAAPFGGAHVFDFVVGLFLLGIRRDGVGQRLIAILGLTDRRKEVKSVLLPVFSRQRVQGAAAADQRPVGKQRRGQAAAAAQLGLGQRGHSLAVHAQAYGGGRSVRGRLHAQVVQQLIEHFHLAVHIGNQGLHLSRQGKGSPLLPVPVQSLIQPVQSPGQGAAAQQADRQAQCDKCFCFHSVCSSPAARS